MISSSMILANPWIVPDETDIKIFGDRMRLSPIEQDHETIYSACPAHTFSLINWIDQSLDYGTPSYPFSCTFFTDKGIMEIMVSNNASWNEHHHHSSFPNTIEDNLSGVYLPDFVKPFTNYVSIHEIECEKNILNIEETIPLDISIKLGMVENLYIGASCSSSETKIYQSLFRDFRDVFSWTYE